MEPHIPTLNRILESGRYDTVLAYYNLLNLTAQEPPPGVNLFDNGQIIPFAKSLDMGVIGIRSHAAGALTEQVDRSIAPGSPLDQDLARARSLDFLLDGSGTSSIRSSLPLSAKCILIAFIVTSRLRPCAIVSSISVDAFEQRLEPLDVYPVNAS